MIKPGNYETSRFLFWFLWGFVAIWSLLLLFWVGVYVQNNAPAHTWFKTADSLGDTLFSLRDSFVAISVRMGIVSIIAIPFIVCAIIGLRQSYIPFIIFIIASILTFFAFSTLSDQYVNCNGANQYGNLCNDAKYGTIGLDLAPNADFLGLYWMIVVFMLAEWVFVVVLIVVRVRGASGAEKEEEEEEEESGAATDADEKKPTENALVTALAPSAMRSTPMHNLRNRKPREK